MRTTDAAPDVLVVGAGAVGAAVAWFATRAGLRVEVVERGSVVSGSTSACEGNLLVSDKEAGPELDLALYSNGVWRDDLAECCELWEFEAKGGLVVAASEAGAQGLAQRAVAQRATGVEVVDVTADEIGAYEPHLVQGLAGGAFYPQDCQVQPMLMAAHLLRLARESGARVRTGTTVTGFLREGERVVGVRTDQGDFAAGCVVNAAGTWAGELATLAGVVVPVLPRRGFILVTEPLPPMVFHKVYAGEYVADTQSSDRGLQTSTVIEGTRAGTILIGSSRERVGFDRTTSLPALREIAAKALDLYPALRDVRVMRSYLGFRPYCPDHLPVIGHDPRAPGLWHAAGHEGAGIGLSVGTAKLLVQAMTTGESDLDLTPFAPERFAAVLADDSEVDPRGGTSGEGPPGRQVESPMARSGSRETIRPLRATGNGPPSLTFNGIRVTARPGQSVGAALTAAGVRSWRTTRDRGRPRGLFCGIGACYDCLLTVDGRPNQRACLVPARDGMRVTSGGVRDV